MAKSWNYLLVALALSALAITLAVTGLGPRAVQAAPPERTELFQHQFECVLEPGSASCSSSAYTVPSGKRLVVENVTGSACLDPGAKMGATLQLGSSVRNLVLGDGYPWFQWTCRGVSQQILAFADAGTVVTASFAVGNLGGADYAGTAGPLSIWVSGELVPAP